MAIGVGLMISGCSQEKPKDHGAPVAVTPPVAVSLKLKEPAPLKIIVSQEKSLGTISLPDGTIEVTAYSHFPYGTKPPFHSVRLEISDREQSNRTSFEQTEIPPLTDAIMRLVAIDLNSLPSEVQRLSVPTDKATFGTYLNFSKYDADIIIEGIRLRCTRDDLKELVRLLSLSQAPGIL